MTAPTSRYGLALRSKHLTSTLAAPGSPRSRPRTGRPPPCSPGPTPGRRQPTATAAAAGTTTATARRWRAAQAGSPSRLAMIDSPVLVRPCRPVPPASRFRPSCQKLACTWPPLPTLSLTTAGANEARSPCRAETAAMTSLTRTLVSAAETGSCARDRHLELSRAVLRVDLLDAHARGFQALEHVADVLGRVEEPAQPVAGAAEGRLEVVGVAADHPLHLDRHQGADALGEPGGDLRPGERPLAVGVDRAVLVEAVAGRPRPAFRVAQDDELVQVGHHPQVAVRLVQRRRGIDAAVADEGVDDGGEADARPRRPGQARAAARP